MISKVTLSSSAMRDLNSVPPRYLDAILTFIFGPLAENPRRLGKPLRDDLSGYHSARRGAYRVIYRIDTSDDSVLVIRVDHRASAYRARG